MRAGDTTNTGYFAPTARYGTAEGLQKLVDQMHQNGIYVLLDFVTGTLCDRRLRFETATMAESCMNIPAGMLG